MRRLISFLVLTTLSLGPQADTLGLRVISSDPPLIDQQLQSEPLAIVVNRSNPVNDLSTGDLREIFLAYRSHWKNGRRITLVMRDPGEPESKTILRDVCGMNQDQFKTHFLHGLYTGEILVSPKTLATPTGVREFIFNVPGAIGYVRFGDLDSSVKVVRVDELLPGEKGYKLRVQSKVN